jgi:glycosyltransferase involved in cell wall biosynthesis
MRIAIDVSQIIYGTGVSNYTLNLVENLLKVDKENEYVLFGGSLRRFTELKQKCKRICGKENCDAEIFPFAPAVADIVWNRLHIFPVEALVGKIDIFHSSDWVQPPTSAYKVTTIHDLVPIKYPKLSDPKVVSVHRARFKRVKRQVERLITPSESTKKDLIDLGVDNKRIVVIPEAPNSVYKVVQRKKVDNLKKRLRIPGKYFLSVGLSPRKNTQRIIKAFRKIKNDNLKLVIVGKLGTKQAQERGVIYTGYLPSSDMPALYAGAEALVYPSLYEGFGLPILEAFACRTPVVTSNVGSMKEIAKCASVMVNPYSIESIAEGMKRSIKEREKFVKRGTRELRKYSWKKTAKKTLQVYRSFY